MTYLVVMDKAADKACVQLLCLQLEVEIERVLCLPVSCGHMADTCMHTVLNRVLVLCLCEDAVVGGDQRGVQPAEA